MATLEDLLRTVSGTLRSRVCTYRGSKRIADAAVPAPGEARVELNGKTWRLNRCVRQGALNGFDVALSAQFVGTKSPPCAFGLEIELDSWSTENYTVMPGAVYSGNRFVAKPLEYPCILIDPDDFRPDVPNTISEVPRLELHEGPSRIQLLAGDMSTPGIGVFFPAAKAGLWLVSMQRTECGEFGYEIEESPDRSRAWLRIMAPGVREGTRYAGGPKWVPSEDRGAKLEGGSETRLEAHVQIFPAETVEDLFSGFLDVRRWPGLPSQPRHELPWSHAFELLERKYNEVNWEEKYGYYACGDRQTRYSHWQIGWVGGMISSHALMAEGDEESRERAARNMDWATGPGQAPSGLYWSFSVDGDMYSDMVDMSWGEDWHLVRRSGDALYFMLRQMSLSPRPHPQEWTESLRKCADAFVRMWDRYGQFGQFVSEETGEIRVGGTASGGIVAAGLTLASSHFGKADYLRVAKEAARHYLRQFVGKGFTSGGPGEAAQCPDSESAFGILESVMALYDLTGEPEWLDWGRAAANHAASWVNSFDFRFPKQSTFGRLDMRTTGSVWANAQNKHSAPGICTLSGVSLFKLFRATGDLRYLELIRDIAHGVSQYLSREDRPIFEMPAGWMCERVNTSDWEKPYIPPGEGFRGGCWCEVSCMLAWVEIPGLYIQPDTGLVCALDHLDVVASGVGAVEVRNPTAFDMRVKVMVESAAEMSNRLPSDFMVGARTEFVPAGGTTVIAY